MVKRQQVGQGQVAAVLITPTSGIGTNATCSQPRDEIEVLVGEGIRGDRHGGTRLSDVRESVLLAADIGREVPIANVRQFSAIAAEDLTAIAAAMQTPQPIPPGLLGENLVIDYLPNLSRLAAGTLLTFSGIRGTKVTRRKAVLAVWGPNHPCYVPEENIERYFTARGMDFTPAVAFGRAARARRGVVGFVYCSGKIKSGDMVQVWQPDSLAAP